MNDDTTQRTEDLDEADQLEATAADLKAKGKNDLAEELTTDAAKLRAKWPALAEATATAEAGNTREADLTEASEIDAMAAKLRAGSAGRKALEADAAALRAKWPEFTDDPDGQVKRLVSALTTRGLLPPGAFLDNGRTVGGLVPARAILELLTKAESTRDAPAAPRTCGGCGLPTGPSGPPTVNTFLLNAVKQFETDPEFREQVKTGSVKPGQSTHPWTNNGQNHKGPNDGKSPWAISTLATMIRNDVDAIRVVGPKLRAEFKERGLTIPAGPN
jgi:hypothetical protein